MRRVLLINSAVYLPGEGGYKRTMYLLDMMLNMGYECVLLTSDFNHYSKASRDISSFRQNYPRYNRSIQILHKVPYKKNVSIKRFYSDKLFERSIAKWVEKNISSFDVVFASDQEAVLNISKLLKEHNVPLVIDIRDLFPEALKVVIKNDTLYRILTWPFSRFEDKAYACADELVAVSQEYLERGLKTNKNSKHPEVVYLGSTFELFDAGIEKYANSIDKQSDEFWITYVGTIGASYDFKTIITAMARLKEKYPGLRFKILGQGPYEEEHKVYASTIGADNVDFLGFMDYQKMAAYLSKTDITINNIKKNASQSIINKVADYFASGKPMLNSCRNEEMQWLIDHYRTGLNYDAENVDDFLKKFEILYSDSEMRMNMGSNARKLAMEKFDRNNSYKKIIKVIEQVTAQ